MNSYGANAATVIVDGIRLKAESAMIRFTTGSGAKITNFHVYNGENKIMELNGVNFTGNASFLRQDIPRNPEVLWGTDISIGVQFNGTGGGGEIMFSLLVLALISMHEEESRDLEVLLNLAVLRVLYSERTGGLCDFQDRGMNGEMKCAYLLSQLPRKARHWCSFLPRRHSVPL